MTGRAYGNEVSPRGVEKATELLRPRPGLCRRVDVRYLPGGIGGCAARIGGLCRARGSGVN